MSERQKLFAKLKGANGLLWNRNFGLFLQEKCKKEFLARVQEDLKTITIDREVQIEKAFKWLFQIPSCADLDTIQLKNFIDEYEERFKGLKQPTDSQADSL